MLGIDTDAINNVVKKIDGVVSAVDVTEVRGAIVTLNQAAANLDAAATNIRLITEKLALAFSVQKET
jgi:hypothetical protein